MNKGFYTDILKNNEKLFSAIIAFNIQNFQSITSHALLQESDNKLFTYINKEFLTNYLQKKYIKNTTDFFYWNFTDETKRLLLVDIESLYQLALLIGISLHANEISLKIKKEEVLLLKEFLGTDNYFYALSRAKFKFHTLCEIYKNKDNELPLSTKIFQHGQNALYHCTTSWEQTLKLFFAKKCQEKLPHLAFLLTKEQNEELSTHKKRLIWFGVKKILTKEVDTKWLPYFS